MNNEIRDFTEEIVKRIEKDSFAIDPLLIIAITNVVINIIKIIMILYFDNEDSTVKNIKSPSFLVKIILRRQIHKVISGYCKRKNLDCKEQKIMEQEVFNAFIDTSKSYGDRKIKNLIKNVTEK